MAKTFEGKVVLVTGANSGIGESIAVAFVDAGATVFGLARRKEGVDAGRSRHPGVKWLLADVTNESQVTQAVGSVVREGGRIDVVVNNAGIAAFAPLEGVERPTWCAASSRSTCTAPRSSHGPLFPR